LVFQPDPDDALDTAAGDVTPKSPFMLSAVQIPLANRTGVRLSAEAVQSNSMTDTTAITVTDAPVVTDAPATIVASAETVPVVPVVARPLVSTEDATRISLSAQLEEVGMTAVAKEHLAALQADRIELSALRDATATKEMEDYLEHAATVEGRIAPSQFPALKTLWAKDPAACRELITASAEKTFPTSPIGQAYEESPEATARKFAEMYWNSK
jgi:hypothetical protein